ESLGDFTTDLRVIPISLLAIAIGCLSTVVALDTAAANRVLHESFLLPSCGFHPGFTRGQPIRSLGNSGSGGRIDGYRIDGALWLRAYSRTRNSRSPGIDSD